jgi:hypothetical protein
MADEFKRNYFKKPLSVRMTIVDEICVDDDMYLGDIIR